MLSSSEHHDFTMESIPQLHPVIEIASVENGAISLHAEAMSKIFEREEIQENPVAIFSVVSDNIKTGKTVLLDFANFIFSQNKDINSHLDQDYFASVINDPGTNNLQLSMFREPVFCHQANTRNNKYVAVYFTVVCSNTLDADAVKLLSGISAALSSTVVLCINSEPKVEHFSWLRDVISTSLKLGIILKLQNVFLLIKAWDPRSSFHLGFQKTEDYLKSAILPKLDAHMAGIWPRFADSVEIFVTYKENILHEKRQQPLKRFYPLLLEQQFIKRFNPDYKSICRDLPGILRELEVKNLAINHNNLRCLDSFKTAIDEETLRQSSGSEKSDSDDKDSQLYPDEPKLVCPWDDAVEAESSTVTSFLSHENSDLNNKSANLSLEFNLVTQNLPSALPASVNGRSYSTGLQEQATTSDIATRDEEDGLMDTFSSVVSTGERLRSIFNEPQVVISSNLLTSLQTEPEFISTSPVEEETDSDINNLPFKQESDDFDSKHALLPSAEIQECITQAFVKVLDSAALSKSTSSQELVRECQKELECYPSEDAIGNLNNWFEEALLAVKALQQKLNAALRDGEIISSQHFFDIIDNHRSKLHFRKELPAIKCAVSRKIDQVQDVYLNLIEKGRKDRDKLLNALAREVDYATDIIMTDIKLGNVSEIGWELESLTDAVVSCLDSVLEAPFEATFGDEVTEIRQLIAEKWEQCQLELKRTDKQNAEMPKEVDPEVYTATATLPNLSVQSSFSKDPDTNWANLDLRGAAFLPQGPMASGIRAPELTKNAAHIYGEKLYIPSVTFPNLNFDFGELPSARAKKAVPKVAIIYNWENIEVFTERRGHLKSIMLLNQNHVSYSDSGIELGNTRSRLSKSCSILDLSRSFLSERGIFSKTFSRSKLSAQTTIEVFCNSFMRLHEMIAEQVHTTDFDAVLSLPPFSCPHLSSCIAKALELSGLKQKYLVVNHITLCALCPEFEQNKEESHPVIIYRSEAVNYTIAVSLAVERERFVLTGFKHQADSPGITGTHDKIRDAIQEVPKSRKNCNVRSAAVFCPSGLPRKVTSEIEKAFETEVLVVIGSNEQLAGPFLQLLRLNKENNPRIISLIRATSLTAMGGLESKCTHTEVI